MKKKVAVLGSTGSIGKKTLDILARNQSKFEILLLTTNKNIKILETQVRKFNVKNVIITSYKEYIEFKTKFKKKKINIYNDFSNLQKIFKNKSIHYTMSSITGLSGLEPTYDIIKYTKKIAIANKESIICAWNLILKELKKNKTQFIPVDSEHFSIWELLKNEKKENVKLIYLTASGGPFLKYKRKQYKKIKPRLAIKHPSWSMGKKISVDSATMMNKVFEVIEAQRIFDINYNNIKILIHPKSYLHAVVVFNNGIIKFLFHETDMKIPIFNSLYFNSYKTIKTKKINFKIINNLKLKKPKNNQFPCLNFLKIIPKKISLFETVLIASNDLLVEYFLKGKITFLDIYKILNKIINNKKYSNLKKTKPINIKQIRSLHDNVRLITRSYCE